MDTRTLIKERTKQYGSYEGQADLMCKTMNIWSSVPGWNNLSHDKRVTLTLILLKIARALHGNPNLRDHWDDIAGYATLSADLCVAGEVNWKPGTPEDGGQHARMATGALDGPQPQPHRPKA